MEWCRTVCAVGCWLEGLCRNGSAVSMTHRAQDTEQNARRGILPRDAMLSELETLLQKQVPSTVTRVYKQERQWSQPEMVKRIVRYIRKAALAKDIAQMPWKTGIEKFLDAVIGSYSASCQDRSWFYDLDLTETLISAVQVILKSFSAETPEDHEVGPFVEQMWEIRLDEILRGKAMWICVEKVFPSNGKAHQKIFTSMKKTYASALDSVLQVTRTIDDVDRLQLFLKTWIQDFMSRVWGAVQNPERILSEEAVVKLFKELMTPFGAADPFCCVPLILTQSTGRPPEILNFIRLTIRAVLRSWQLQEREGSSRKKRKITFDSRTARPVQHSCQSDLHYVSVKKTTEYRDDVDGFVSEIVAHSDPEGHPECS